jgi:hypothetical protein
MAHVTGEVESDKDVVKFLAVVQTNGTTGFSDDLYVKSPDLKGNTHSFHTNPVSTTTKPEYHKDVSEYRRGEHITLVYEPGYGNKYVLTRVESAQVTEPEDYETVGDSDYPKICPNCGRNTVAVVNEDDKYDRAFSYDADHCIVGEDRLSWFNGRREKAFIH